MARTRWPSDPVNPGLLPRPGRSDRQRRRVPENLGPGRQIVSQDSPSGVSRIGGQAGTQAPDPTPAPSPNHGSRAGSTIHSLPAEYSLVSSLAVSALCGRKSASKCRTPTRRMRILLISVSSVRQASPCTEPGMHSRGGLPRGAGKVSGARSGCDRPQLHGLTFSIECSLPRGWRVRGMEPHDRTPKRAGKLVHWSWVS
jgi:hypothetical protein